MSGAAVRETRIGLVVLAGDRAYKAKKPVVTAVCDFSTLALRRAALEREHRLNARLAPDVYLGTTELAGAGCGEPVLVMRRMPESARLSNLIRSGADPSRAVRGVARRVAAFHAGAARGPAIDAAGSAAALAQRWQRLLDELAPFRDTVLPGDDLDEARRLADGFVAGRSALFASRIEQGRIVDGHGDLVADDVFCLEDGPRVLDCLDFDDTLRFVDGLDDVCLLAMDLERLGAPDVAAQLLEDYADFSADPAPAALRDHFIAYRAGARATMDCARHAQAGEKATAVGARAHLARALDHLRRGEPRLALVGGLPGTGKSTVAADLANATGAVLLAGDGLTDTTSPDGVCAELLERAELLLGLGESVVLDASWTDRRHREQALAVARRTCARAVQLECRAPAELAAARIRHRAGPASDATPAAAVALAERADPWPDADPVTTTAPAPVCALLARRRWT